MSLRDRRAGILFLGCGWATRIHSRILRRTARVDLYYASQDPTRAEVYRQRFGGRAAFESYDAGLADARVDVALIATPTVTHRDLTLAALAAGRHVIVEKPAFMSAADADVVRDAAASAGRRVFVAENYVYKPIATYLRRRIAHGDLGDVRFVMLDATKRQPASGWRSDPALSGGGALFEAGVHWVSFASNIGLDVSDISAHRVGADEGPDRSSLLVFRYANGAVGTLAHSWELRAPFGALRVSKVQGTEGAVTFESNGLAAFTTGKRRSLFLPSGDALGYRAMLADFLWALRTGGPELFTLEMAQRDLLLLEKAQSDMSSIEIRGQKPVEGPADRRVVLGARSIPLTQDARRRTQD